MGRKVVDKIIKGDCVGPNRQLLSLYSEMGNYQEGLSSAKIRFERFDVLSERIAMAALLTRLCQGQG